MKSIRVKILTPIMLLAVVCVAYSFWGIASTRTAREKSNEISQVHLSAIQNLEEISGDFQNLQKLLLKHFLMGNEEMALAVEEQMTTIRGMMDEDLASYGKLITDEKERERFNQFSEKYTSFLELYDKSLTHSKADEKADAIEIANYDLAEISTEMEIMVESGLEDLKANVDAARKSQDKLFSEIIQLNTIMIVISFVLCIGATIMSMVTVVIPSVEAIKHLKAIIFKLEHDECDLSERIPVKTQDEIGQLVSGINAFLKALQSVIGDVSGGSDNLNQVIDNVSQSLSNVNDSSCDVSTVMEELATSMEEVSATITKVDTRINNVNESISNFTNVSEGILDYSQQMQDRASGLEKNAIKSQDTTSEMVGEIIEKLKIAIENCKSVEQVETLTNDILNISSQTNLLALNASIEAARAGEAGKGFAVVANEIRQLADSSRSTANDIQHINENVVAAVNELSENSNRIVDYIGQTILPDYHGFVEAGQQYTKDSIYVNDEMKGFEQRTQELHTIISELVDAIENISGIIEQSAEGVSSAAGGTASLTEELQKIGSQMDSSIHVADRMKAQCDRFVV